MDNSKVDAYLVHTFHAAEEAPIRTASTTVFRRPAPWLPFLVRTRDPNWQPEHIPEFEVSSQLGRVFAGRGTMNCLRALQDDPMVVSVEASRPGASYEVATSLPFVRADVAQTQFGETGDRALIAFIDSGIDILHNAFLDAAGTGTRILAIWDHSPWWASTAELIPQDDINRYIQDGTAPRELRDPLKHGTHVASIAAGRKGARFAGGVAPDAKILMAIPNHNFAPTDPNSTGYSKGHVDALAFIKQFAQERNLPVVVNVSQGMNAGAHDGKSPLEIAFDEFSGGGREPGFVIVKSAGNERNQKSHAMINLVLQGQQTLSWSVKIPTTRVVGTEPEVTVELWFDSADELQVALVHPGGATSPWVTLTNPSATGHFFYRTRYDVTYVRRHQDNGDSRVVATLRPHSGSGIEAGDWTLQIRSPVVRSPTGTAHAWIERQGGFAQFATFVNEEITLTIPGTADTVIAVGSIAPTLPYQLADYSCFGPTRDGRQKPDVAAPGEGISAARAGTLSGVRVECGTSMAAPHVTGAIALLLSRRAKLRDSNPALEQLNANQIKKILAQSAQNFGGTWNPGMGFGVLDVAAALQEASAI